MAKTVSNKPRLLLAIDAAKKAGIALFLDGKLVGYAAADGSSWVTLVQSLRPLVANYDDIPQLERHCVIESGWFAGRNAKATLTLERRRGLAQAAAEACGFHQHEWVSPSTWHSAIFGGKRPEDVKQASLVHCKALYGVDAPTDDVSDAVLIGTYCLNQFV